MSNPMAYESVLTVESPQPAIIIGIGEFGQAVLDRIRMQRDVYKTPLAGEDAGSMSPRVLPTDHTWWQLDSSTIRAKQLAEAALRELARDLRELFNTVRLHRDAPLFDTLRPVIIVVGATWSESGSALLWPLAGIIRAAIGSSMQYALHGVFVAADYREEVEKREYGDALTWNVLDEGDRLAAGEVIWQGKIRSGITSDLIDTRLYDTVFLIDGHKENNGSIGHDNNMFEVATHVTSLLEGLIYSTLPRALDQALLDDHSYLSQQRYVGVGSSALVVPLRDITNLVRRFAMGKIIQDRLLTMPNGMPAVDQQTTSRIDAELKKHVVTSLQRVITHACEEAKKRPLQHATNLNYQVTVDSLYDTIIPDIRKAEVQSVHFAATDEQVDADEILARQQEEREQAELILADCQAQLVERRAKLVYATEDAVGRPLVELLANGGTGLIRAVETLRTYARQLEQQSALSEQQALTSESKSKILYHRMTDQRKWFGINLDEMLRQAVNLRAHIPAMFVRATLLIILLFQFYWDAHWKTATTPFPMDSFFSIDDERMLFGAGWYDILNMAFILVIIPTLFLTILPYVGVAWQQRVRRQMLEKYMQERLRAMSLADTAFLCDVLAKRIANQRLADLSIAKDELQTYADRAMRATSQEELVREREVRQRIDYLESLVVEPSDVLHPYQAQVLANITKVYGPNIVTSWRPRSGAVNDYWRVESINSIVERLEAQIEPVVSDITTKTIDYYVQGKDMIALMHRLWRASVPWIKAAHGVESADVYSRMRLDVLLVSRKVKDEFLQVIDGPDGKVVAVDWPDTYRVMMLRMHCGIVAHQLIRWRQLVQVGEATQRQFGTMLPESVTHSNQLLQITHDPDLNIDDLRLCIQTVTTTYAEYTSNYDMNDAQIILSNMAIDRFMQVIKNERLWIVPGQTLLKSMRYQIPQLLRHYDIFMRSQATDETIQATADFQNAVGMLLQLFDIETYAPEQGIFVTMDQPMTIMYSRDPLIPADVILACKANGYRLRQQNQVLLPPLVVVNRNE